MTSFIALENANPSASELNSVMFLCTIIHKETNIPKTQYETTFASPADEIFGIIAIAKHKIFQCLFAFLDGC